MFLADMLVSYRDSEYYKEKRYYWCLTCNATVMEDTSCLKNHDTHDLKTDAGREMAENHLKTLFVTCKAQLNGSLAKHQEVKVHVICLSSAEI